MTKAITIIDITCISFCCFYTLFSITILSAVVMMIVEIVNGSYVSTKHYNKTTARVLEYEISGELSSNDKFISIHLEYIVDNKTINSWTALEKISSRAAGKRYFRNLDKDKTEIIYRKDILREAIILPVKWKIRNLWIGWIVIGSIMISSFVFASLCFLGVIYGILIFNKKE